MTILSKKDYFLGLSIVAVVLLWGLSLWNGTVKALFHATTAGHFEDETLLKTVYTGVYVLDFPLSLLVAFFFHGTNGKNKIYQLFLIDAYGSLQPAFIWLYVEANRGNKKTFSVANPIYWGILWQAFGGAISLPFYYLKHLEWLRGTTKRLECLSLASARALPVSFALGAILPAVAGMLPLWVNRSVSTHQDILAVWQLDPLWVSICQATLVILFTSLQTRTKDDERVAVWWTRMSYIIAAVFSFISHLYAVTSIVSDHGWMELTRAYVPYLHSQSPGMDDRLIHGPWLFLQFDLMIIALSSLSWAYVLAVGLVQDPPLATVALLLVLAASGLLLGPGTTVSMILFWREDILQQVRAKGDGRRESKMI